MIPEPRHTQPGRGAYRLCSATSISVEGDLTSTAGWLRGRLQQATGLPLPLATCGGAVRLTTDTALGPEGYRLLVGTDGVQITGGDRSGVFYGCQALLQLLPPDVYRQAPIADIDWVVPNVEITDAPRFSWRGTMLDVARHFLPKREVLRFIDLMAMHRLNTLHLHLTDDQGWRLEIKQFPRLTDVGGWRAESQVGAGSNATMDGRPYGGYYTQDDIREIVAYAEARAVTVVPEIEMPGHVQAAIAAYPRLGPADTPLEVGTQWGIIPHVLNMEEQTVDFFKAVLDEVVDLFPSPFIGVGGDECPTTQWQQDPRTQQLMRERGIKRESDLQSWFLARIGEHLSALGRRMYGWDEMLEGAVPQSTVVASWRGMKGAFVAARRGHDVVSCPDVDAYLDYRQSDRDDEPIPVGSPLDLDRAFGFDPVPDGLTAAESAHILGGQANLWSEHMDSPRVVDYMAFPRLCAIAEALWTADEHRDVVAFHGRLNEHLARLDALGVEYRAADGPRPWQLRPDIPGRPTSLEQRLQLVEELVSTIEAD